MWFLYPWHFEVMDCVLIYLILLLIFADLKFHRFCRSSSRDEFVDLHFTKFWRYFFTVSPFDRFNLCGLRRWHSVIFCFWCFYASIHNAVHRFYVSWNFATETFSIIFWELNFIEFLKFFQIFVLQLLQMLFHAKPYIHND